MIGLPRKDDAEITRYIGRRWHQLGLIKRKYSAPLNRAAGNGPAKTNPTITATKDTWSRIDLQEAEAANLARLSQLNQGLTFFESRSGRFPKDFGLGSAKSGLVQTCPLPL
jgi:hypothetical protein